MQQKKHIDIDLLIELEDIMISSTRKANQHGDYDKFTTSYWRTMFGRDVYKILDKLYPEGWEVTYEKSSDSLV